ncbi:hypothetical protein [Streptomyces hesseae]|uniref:Uncharacterized protein n=1 Tax=Streptomyces hesseae TaxID=3075519 RepID=A0ABU2SNY1_9ACTN|nr:hypothetical protein [Streptomyces sp. DSM 40473]MDT0450595.1 hypothetical protein [Streptomyces sp. DSM 40473]
MGSFMLRPVDALWAAARTVEVSPRHPAAGERSVMVGDAGEIAELAGLLEVDLSASGFLCMCLGDVDFTVRGEMGRELGVLTYHMSSSLDWCQWDGQLPLLRPADLAGWLVGRGVITLRPAA